MKINSVLLPTDFSEGSNIAVAYALAIAEKTGAHIHFLHMQPTPVDWRKIPLEKEQLYPEIKAKIGKAKRALFELEKVCQSRGVESHIHLIFNQGSEDIIEHVNSGKYDFVVMASHGAKGVREYIIGSNAQRVIKHSNIPVLVVKKMPSEIKIKDIVFYSKFEDMYRQPFEKLANFVEKFHATLHLLYINTPYHFQETQDIQQRLVSFCEEGKLGDCKKYIYNALNDERGIDAFMKKEDMDILAIATSNTPGWGQLFSPSLTEDLVNHLDIPILSIKV